MARPILKIANFCFAYPNGEKQLVDCNLSLEQGDFAILAGSTGSGKSTLLKSILGSEFISGNRSGAIEVTADRIGYVAQEIESQLVCDTVWHELAFSLENYGFEQSLIRRRIAEVSSFFSIDPWFRCKISELSGGQKQLVNLCRALAVGPELLLLDEPTSELDSVAEKNFLHALFRLNRELGITILLASHSPNLMSNYATKLFTIKDHAIAESEIKSSSYRSNVEHTSRKVSENTCISLDDVYVRYDSSLDFVLRGMDAKISRGEITSLIGGNAAGKTTMLKAIAGILKPVRGKIKNDLKESQAYLPQHPSALFVCDSVIEELKEWQKNCNYTDDYISEMLEKIGLADRQTLHPYDLSGGQKQLLALTKLTLTKPDLLLLDEPTKGLDVNSRLEVAKLLQSERERGCTIVMVSHDLEFAEIVSDTIIQVFDGCISAKEPSNEFFKNSLFIKPVPSEFGEQYPANV